MMHEDAPKMNVAQSLAASTSQAKIEIVTDVPVEYELNSADSKLTETIDMEMKIAYVEPTSGTMGNTFKTTGSGSGSGREAPLPRGTPAPHLEAESPVVAEGVEEGVEAYAMEQRLFQDAAARLYRQHLRNDAEAERRRRRVMNAEELQELRAAWRAAVAAAQKLKDGPPPPRRRIIIRRGSSMRTQ